MSAWCDLDIRKTFGDARGVFQLDVQMHSAAPRIALTGPSGIGKTQVLKAIAGLMRPDAGHVRIGGRVLFDERTGTYLPPQQRRIGFLFQDYALLPHLTVLSNAGAGLRRGPWGFLSRPQKEKAMEWLERFQIAHLAHQYPDTLSGGQQQRLALVRLALSQPRVMLLDEPFSALDPVLRRTMRAEVDRLLRMLDIPLLMVSHDDDDRVALDAEVLRLGQVDGRTLRLA